MKHFLLVLLVGLTVLPAQAQSAEELLQNALRLERSEGDYAGAIALYRQVAESSEFARAVTGRALVQIAMAYENMGRAEAARTYQRVLAEYGDLPELVAEAREGFARTVERTPTRERLPTQTVLDVGEHFENWGSGMSPSGRYLTGYNYEPAGVRVIDTWEGLVDDLELDPNGYGEYPRFSPDESEIALGWHEGDKIADLIVIDRADGQSRELLSVSDYYRKRDGLAILVSTVHPLDWTSDGSSLVAYVGASEIRGAADEENWVMEFLMVPVDGGAPKLLGGLDGASRYAWEKACISDDDRFLFVDYYRQIEGRQNPYYIRRFDLESGESRVWRDAPTGGTRLVGCTGEAGNILYQDGAIGAPAVRLAAATDEDPSDDRLVTRLSEDAYLALGAESGDVSAFMAPASRGITLFDVDEDSGQITGTSHMMDVGHVRGMDWSPSGHRLAYFDTDTKGDRIGIYNPADGTEVDHVIDPLMTGLWWETERSIAFSLDTPSRANDWTQVFDVGLLDLETGSATKTLSASDLSELELRVAQHVGGDTWWTWSPESRCLVSLQAPTLERSEVGCFKEWAGVSLFPSRDEQQYAVRARVEEAQQFEIGLLAKDGSYRSVYRSAAEGHRVLRLAWLDDSHVVMARGDRSWNYTSAERLNLHTGTVAPMYASLFEQFNVRRLEIRPGGGMLAVYGSPKTARDGSQLVTIMRGIAEVR